MMHSYAKTTIFKYCEADDQSRKQHETGLKHQGNKERFIRDLYKSGSVAKREKANAEAEMARINAVRTFMLC